MVHLSERKRIFFAVWDECHEENEVIKSITLRLGLKLLTEKYLTLDTIQSTDRGGKRWLIHFKDFFWHYDQEVVLPKIFLSSYLTLLDRPFHAGIIHQLTKWIKPVQNFKPVIILKLTEMLI